MKFPTDFTPSFTPSLEIVQEIDFVTRIFNLLIMGAYNSGDMFSFSDKFYNDPIDITDISKNYIGYDKLINLIANIYYKTEDLNSLNGSLCSIYEDPSTMSSYCTEYSNIYICIFNVINDLNSIWEYTPNPIEFPDDMTSAVIADIINSLNDIQSIFV
jgi:hypothetical protein